MEYSYQEVLLNILPQNDGPIWDDIGDRHITEDVDVDNMFNLEDYVYDIESPFDTINFTVFYNENSSKINVDIDENMNVDVSFAEAHYTGRTFVKLEAEDSHGGKSYGSFNLIVDPLNDLPIIELQSHTEGQKVYDSINLEGIAIDVDGLVELVEIRFDENPIWSPLIGTGYWTYVWDTTTVADGPHKVHLRAKDDIGEFSSDYTVTLQVSNVDAPNELPEIEITEPEDGEQVSNEVTIRGTSIDIDHGIDHVEVKVDDGEWEDAQGSIDWFITINTTGFSNGLHTIYVRSFDGKAYSSVDNITVHVFNLVSSDKDKEKDTSDKSSGSSMNFLYIILIVIVIIVLIVAYAGVVVKKKKKAEMDRKEEEDKKAAEAISAEATPQIAGTVGKPTETGLPPAPQPAAAPALATGGPSIPQPIQLTSYPQPTEIPAAVPQLPPGPTEPAPDSTVPPSTAPVPAPAPAQPPAAASAQPPAAVPAPQPTQPPAAQPAAPPAAIPAQPVAPAAAPSAEKVIDIQGISVSSTPQPSPQPQGEAPMTKPVQPVTQNAYTVDVEYSPQGESKTVGKPKKQD
jgi:hypothetical protein